MDFRRFSYFLAAVKEMSFTRAAQNLHISQQALSSHIQKLEEQYGVVLFERKPNLRLTLAGEHMAFYAMRLVEDERLMNASLADVVENKKARLLVGFIRSASNIFMPLIWERYRQVQPHIVISLVENMTSKLDVLMQENEIDLYIGINAPVRLDTCRYALAKDLFYCAFSAELLQTCMPGKWREFLLSCHDGVDLLQMKNFPFLMLPKGNRLRVAVDQIFSAPHVNPQVVFETSNHELIYQLSKKGCGVGLFSWMYLYRSPVLQKLDTEDFYVFPIKNDLPPYTLDLVYRSDGMQPNFINVFIEIVKSVFRELGDFTPFERIPPT
ncbi:MAG: LysR family transcriptional regulator [Synergistaceae bacterium]|jgi:DNA-binding transcriptional LysR family regulator|nr:LysR family transcriptional regulator [Synergistaceae bacterium]